MESKEVMPCDHTLENGDTAIMPMNGYYQCGICGEWWAYWEFH